MSLFVFGDQTLGFMSAPPARRVPAPGWWWWLWVLERAVGPWVLDKAAHVRPRGPHSSSCRGFYAVELWDTLRGNEGRRGSSRDMKSPPPGPESVRCRSQTGMIQQDRWLGSDSRCCWLQWEHSHWWRSTPRVDSRPRCCCPSWRGGAGREARWRWPTPSHLRREGVRVGWELRSGMGAGRVLGKEMKCCLACPGSWCSPWAPPPHPPSLGPAGPVTEEALNLDPPPWPPSPLLTVSPLHSVHRSQPLPQTWTPPQLGQCSAPTWGLEEAYKAASGSACAS